MQDIKILKSLGLSDYIIDLILKLAALNNEGLILGIQEGTDISVDNADPAYPKINAVNQRTTSLPLSAITAATGNSGVVNHTNKLIYWNWSSLVSNPGLVVISTSTAMVTTGELMQVWLSGANANDNVSSISLRVHNDKTGTGAINTGLTISATGGSTNYALLTNGGRIGFGTTTPNASALLDMVSLTQGFLPPRMNKAARDAIASPAIGLTIYQSDNTPGLRVYNGTHWVRYTETNDD